MTIRKVYPPCSKAPVRYFKLLPLAIASTIAAGPVYAVDLRGIIRDAMQNYPTMQEAQINVESAEAQTNQYKLLHMPTFGMQATRPAAAQAANTSYGTAFTGKLNLYAGGAIEERVRASKYQEEYQGHIVDQTGLDLAYAIAQIYLDGLTVKEQMVAAQENWNRHQKIIDDLKIIVNYDQGRRADLIQAQSRQLQVSTRLLQLQSDLRSDESKLQKYLTHPDKIDWFPLTGVDELNTDFSQHPTLLAQYAEEQRAESQSKLAMKDRRPKLDLDMVGGSNRAANLVVNWNFFDLATRASQAVTDNDIKIAKAKTDDVRRSIQERVSTAKIQAEQARLTMNGTRAQIVAAKEVVDAYEQQFMIARRNILDVLNSYSDLSNIEAADVTTKGAYRQALISLKYASGELVQWAMQMPMQKAGELEPTAIEVNKYVPRREGFGGQRNLNADTPEIITNSSNSRSTPAKAPITIYPNVNMPVAPKEVGTKQPIVAKPVRVPSATVPAVSSPPATMQPAKVQPTRNVVIYPNINQPFDKNNRALIVNKVQAQRVPVVKAPVVATAKPTLLLPPAASNVIRVKPEPVTIYKNVEIPVAASKVAHAEKPNIDKFKPTPAELLSVIQPVSHKMPAVVIQPNRIEPLIGYPNLTVPAKPIKPTKEIKKTGDSRIMPNVTEPAASPKFGGGVGKKSEPAKRDTWQPLMPVPAQEWQLESQVQETPTNKVTPVKPKPSINEWQPLEPSTTVPAFGSSAPQADVSSQKSRFNMTPTATVNAVAPVAAAPVKPKPSVDNRFSVAPLTVATPAVDNTPKPAPTATSNTPAPVKTSAVERADSDRFNISSVDSATGSQSNSADRFKVVQK